MSSFWLGAFTALAVWNLITTIASVAMYDGSGEGERDILINFTLMVVFMAIAWWVATFGGG